MRLKYFTSINETQLKTLKSTDLKVYAKLTAKMLTNLEHSVEASHQNLCPTPVVFHLLPSPHNLLFLL